MCYNRFSDASMSDRYDDAGFIVWPNDRRVTRSNHFAALGRGLLVLALLALPIALTLMGIAPPIDSEPEIIYHAGVVQPDTSARPLSQAVIQRLRIQG